MAGHEMKKGQVTLFVIIGILIILGVALFLIFRERSVPTEQTISSIQIPSEFSPLNEFVTSCVTQVSKDAIIKAGQHGGYTDIRKYGIQPQGANPTNGRAFLLNPQDAQT